MLKALFGSRKFVVGLMAVVAVVLVKALNVAPETADAIAKAVMTVAALYIGGTALEDAGAKLLSGNGEAKPTDETPAKPPKP